MRRPQSLRHLSGSTPALGTDVVHDPRGHFSPGLLVWWNYALLFTTMPVLPTMPRSGRWPRATVDARSDPDRSAAGCLRGDADMLACGGAEPGPTRRCNLGTERTDPRLCARPMFGTRSPYSLDQWCQRPLKRTLKQDPGSDARACLRATSLVFRQRIRLEW
jgi:hypothetical protein